MSKYVSKTFISLIVARGAFTQSTLWSSVTPPQKIFEVVFHVFFQPYVRLGYIGYKIALQG